jgi:hypothetical protein
MPEQRSGNWTIELRVYPIPEIGYFGGHIFWVLKDPDGNVREELHFFGQPGTDLRFKHRKETDIEADNRYMRGSIRAPLLQYSAPYEEILQRWEAGRNVGELLQSRQHFDYPSEWDTIRAAAGDGSITNSNAGAYTIGKVMLPALVKKEKSTKIPTPGWGVDLFDYEFPEDAPEAPGAENPNIDLHPDFRNETRNKEDGHRAASANQVHLTSYGLAASNDSAPRRATPAMRALNAAKADVVFTKRYLKGERDAVDRMHALHRAAFPEPGDATVRPAVRPDTSDSSVDSFSTARRDLTPARQALEAAKTDSGFVRSYLDGDRKAFARMRSLIQAAYPEPDDSGAAGGGPAVQHDTANGANTGLAPWLGDALAGNALRDEGADPTMAGWLGDWRDASRRRY